MVASFRVARCRFRVPGCRFPGFRVVGSHEFSRLFFEKTELWLRRKSNLAGMRKSFAGWFPARFFCNVFLIIPHSGYRVFMGLKLNYFCDLSQPWAKAAEQ